MLFLLFLLYLYRKTNLKLKKTDFDFLKLSNLTLSYNVGNLGGFRNVNVSLTGQNLFVFTGYNGFDPEVNTDGASGGIPSLGIEYLPYPSARTFLLGVNFSL